MPILSVEGPASVMANLRNHALMNAVDFKVIDHEPGKVFVDLTGEPAKLSAVYKKCPGVTAVAVIDSVPFERGDV